MLNAAGVACPNYHEGALAYLTLHLLTLTLTLTLTLALALALTLALTLALALAQGEHPARPSPARLVQAQHRHACDVEAPAWLAQLGDARERGMQQQGRRREGRDRRA